MRRLFAPLLAIAAIGAAIAADNAPIGVFDSGVGGLTVLEQMLAMDRYDNVTGERHPDGRPDFDRERFVYFGDQANMPYGDYSAAGKSEYLRKLIVADAEFLLAKKAKVIVIACNTATAWGLDRVTERASRDGVRTIGVIGAGVRSALALPAFAAATGPLSIGVIATPGTIASGAYERTIRAEAARLGLKARISVFSQGCPGLADAVEAGDPKANEIAQTNLRALLAQHAAATNAGPVAAIILGCTHYPFVLPALQEIAPEMPFVDPAIATAEECFLSLRDADRAGAGAQSLSAYISVPARGLDPKCLDAEGNLTRAVKYGRELDDPTVWTEPKAYGRAESERNAFIRRALPATWRQISAGSTDR